MRDVVLIAMHHGGWRHRPYDPRYDLNHDGRVDTRDLLLALFQLGRLC